MLITTRHNCQSRWFGQIQGQLLSAAWSSVLFSQQLWENTSLEKCLHFRWAEYNFYSINMFKVKTCIIDTRMRKHNSILYLGMLKEIFNFHSYVLTDLVITRQFLDTHPNSGMRSLVGFLRGMSLRFQRSSVGDSLVRTDPRGIEARFRQALHLRQYSVCMSNSFGILTDAIKLIKWCVVLHGGINGCSRLPVYLQAFTNIQEGECIQLEVVQCVEFTCREHQQTTKQLQYWMDSLMPWGSMDYLH